MALLMLFVGALTLLVSTVALVVVAVQVSTGLIATYGVWLVGGAAVGGIVVAAILGFAGWALD